MTYTLNVTFIPICLVDAISLPRLGDVITILKYQWFTAKVLFVFPLILSSVPHTHFGSAQCYLLHSVQAGRATFV